MARRIKSPGTVGSPVSVSQPNMAMLNSEDSKVTQVGTWSSVEDNEAAGGSYLRSNTTNSYLQFSFKGSALWVRFKFGSDCGKASITIDATAYPTVDLYNALDLFKYVNVAIGLDENVTHTVKITVAGTKNAGSTDYYVNIDAFTYRLTEEALSLQNIEYIDLINVINTINKINEIKLISNIANISLIQELSNVGNIANISSVDVIDEVSTISAIQKVNLISEITGISTIGKINLISQIANISNIELVKTLSTITQVNLIAQITGISSIGLIKSLSSITGVSTIGKVSKINTISDIYGISDIGNISNIANISLVAKINEIKSIGDVGTNIAKPEWLRNPSFETGDLTGWSLLNGTATVTTSPLYEGEYACRMQPDTIIEQTVSPFSLDKIVVTCGALAGDSGQKMIITFYTAEAGTQSQEFALNAPPLKTPIIWEPTVPYHPLYVDIEAPSTNTSYIDVDNISIYIKSTDVKVVSNVANISLIQSLSSITGVSTIGHLSTIGKTLPRMDKSCIIKQEGLGVGADQTVLLISTGYKVVIYGYNIVNNDAANVGDYNMYLDTSARPLYLGKIRCEYPVLKTFVHPVEGGSDEDVKITIAGSTDTDVVLFADIEPI